MSLIGTHLSYPGDWADKWSGPGPPIVLGADSSTLAREQDAAQVPPLGGRAENSVRHDEPFRRRETFRRHGSSAGQLRPAPTSWPCPPSSRHGTRLARYICASAAMRSECDSVPSLALPYPFRRVCRRCRVGARSAQWCQKQDP